MHDSTDVTVNTAGGGKRLWLELTSHPGLTTVCLSHVQLWRAPHYHRLVRRLHGKLIKPVCHDTVDSQPQTLYFLLVIHNVQGYPRFTRIAGVDIHFVARLP